MKRLVAELRVRRLVTLSGPGGVGKTRLALEAAWLSAEEQPEGAWLVELAPTGDPRAVPAVVAEALGVAPQAGASPTASIVDALTGRRTLVVIDNAEHVLDAVAELVGSLVSACAGVTVLVTSREPVGLAGERVWPVPPLDPATEGVELFEERARAVDGGYVGYDRDTVEVMCRRLDGIPLAIELVAARARSMSPKEMVARLDDRFRLVRGASRGRAERHQTLQAAVDWSYQLLSDDEQRLFDRLAVFAGTFDLEAAEAVCADDSLDAWDVDDLLRALVDKSMVGPDVGPEGTRYHLLETLRQFGRDHLDARGERQHFEERHVAHYLAVAKQARADFEGVANAVGVIRFEFEWDNLRAAVATAVARADVVAAEGLVVSSLWYAYWGLNHEHSAWADETLRLAGVGPNVHGIAGMWAVMRGELREGLRHGMDGLEKASHPDHADTAACWIAVGLAHWYLGEPAKARPAVLRYQQVAERIGDPWLIGQSSAFVAILLSAYDKAISRGMAERAREVTERLGNASGRAYAYWALSVCAVSDRRFDEALRWNQEAAALAELSRNRFVAGVATMGKALAARYSRQEPSRTYADALKTLYRTRDWIDIWMVIDSLALLWVDAGRAEPAAVLLGHLKAHKIRYPVHASRRDDATRALEQRSGGPAWLARGAQLDRHALVAYALDVLKEAVYDLPDQRTDRADGTDLTTREREIVALVATGITNLEIAERLYISERTVETHITRIRRKLGTTTRTQLAVWALENVSKATGGRP